jgi:NADH-quinone oxidoreductase subunit L
VGALISGLMANFPANDFGLLAIVLLAPAIGAFVNGVFGKRLGKDAVRLMALSALGASFLASVVTFLALAAGPHQKLTWVAWKWIDLQARGGSNVKIDVAFGVDAMTATMMLVVTGVGFLIHLYSSEYMKNDPGYHRFFAYLNLFCFAMLTLIMGDNLAVLFVGWEGVGLCSYLLIGFWFDNEKYASAGKKAFIVNRIGDFGLLVAMAGLLYYARTLSWDQLNATAASSLSVPVTIWPIGNIPTEQVWDAQFAAQSMWPGWLAHIFLPETPYQIYASTLIGLAIFLGCAGKSAQMPLYVWLPDAMAGPTPVSALIHAATMVTAGVYLVARTSAIFVMSPAAMAVVAITGAFTAVFAASMGLFQKDLKKVLAYSTVSQLGFMFIGVGTGAFISGFFHVFTHAFFKACLFLGAGSVIHAMHARIHDTDASQDMNHMGGLKKYMPVTHWTFLLSCLAIAGVPGFAGFFSKDEILWKAFSEAVTTPALKDAWAWPSWLGPAIYVAGIVGATMTAFYMFRAYFMTFHGEFKGWTIVKGWVDPSPAGHPHGHGHDDHDDAHADDHAHGDAHAKVAHGDAHGDDAHGDDAHDDHQDHEVGVGKIEGPVPHESPIAMTLPLVVLAAFAVFGGLLGATPLHIEPLVHFLEPVFTRADALVNPRPGIEPHGSLMWLMMLPGVAAAAVGIGAAYKIYFVDHGAGEASFKKAYPGLYQLLFDRWRIDELYDATVVGMLDALADIFTMADKWIIDGIIARLSAVVVGAAGSLLRLFHSGRVQVYAASMAIGVAGMGFYLARPHAAVQVNDELLKQTGEVVLNAAPGLGYSYSWSGLTKADATDAPKFEAKREQRVVVAANETREVQVRVRNAFGMEAQTTITLSRKSSATPGAPGAGAPPGHPAIPGRVVPNQVAPKAVVPKPGGAPPDDHAGHNHPPGEHP